MNKKLKFEKRIKSLDEAIQIGTNQIISIEETLRDCYKKLIRQGAFKTDLTTIVNSHYAHWARPGTLNTIFTNQEDIGYLIGDIIVNRIFSHSST
ncbi:MAG: hypothetical protein K8H85_01025, partial [Cyclobacteriaceae bacterium]|nr:hypothetical protein [Cyclobacteriaceae bacterium]